MSKYEVTSGPYFPVFSPNTGKYGPEITPYLDTFHAVRGVWFTCTFLNHFRKAVSNNYAPCFNRTDFVVIPSNIELPWADRLKLWHQQWVRHAFRDQRDKVYSKYTKSGLETLMLMLIHSKYLLKRCYIEKVLFRGKRAL